MDKLSQQIDRNSLDILALLLSLDTQIDDNLRTELQDAVKEFADQLQLFRHTSQQGI